jgi:HlyD family secretion protein
VKRTILIVAAVAVVALVGFFGYQQFLAPVEPTPTPQIDLSAQPALPSVVSAEGFVVPDQDADLSFKVGSQVAEVLVAEGDEVQAGQVLIRLDSSQQQKAVAQAQSGVVQAQASLTSAEARLDQALAGPTAQAIAQAQAAVDTAKARLAQTKAGPTQEAIAQAEAAVQVAQAQLNELLAGARPEDIQAAAADVLTAQAAQRQAQAEYDKIAWAGDVGERPEAVALEQATLAYQAAQARYDRVANGPTAQEIAVAQAAVTQAQAALANVKAGPSQEQIAVAEAGVKEAEAALATVQAGSTDQEIAIAKAGVEEAKAGLGAAQAAYELAEANLADYQLVAPYASTVARISTHLGEFVSPGVPVVSLGDTADWHVETDDLTEIDVVQVAVGQPVNVTIDAIPDRDFSGVVTKIAPKSETKRGDVTYTVTIKLNDVSDAPLRWGLTAFVDINVD